MQCIGTERLVSVYVKCYLANVQSVHNKLPELEFLLSCGYSAIGITETFLTSADLDSLLLTGAPNYVVFRSDCLTRRGGGVTLFCMQSTNPVHVSVPEKFTECECIAVGLSG